jgi:polyferredoxin
MSKTLESTLQPSGDESFYVSEGKVYPRDVQGRYQRLRVIAAWLLLGWFYAAPWFMWDGRQAVLLDLPARKFHIFGLTFFPQDFFFLAVLLIMAGLSLFFFTALAGRLWCGYACPQTVWTEIFLWVEKKIEGDRHRRMKLDASPWHVQKVLRKGSKHIAWLLLALLTGFTFVGLFTPVRDLGARLVVFEWGGWEFFWVLFYSLATWGNAGILREQVCKYMCPYARFQSAMFDRNTLIIAYDPMRGEPRGSRKRGLGSVLERARGLLGVKQAEAAVIAAARQRSAADARVVARVSTGLLALDAGAAPTVSTPEDLGDCIDCTLCVQVCPTGIDIRNGLQYECIACAACIDACDAVMDKVGYPRGLIRHTTQNAIDGKPQRILRPRIMIYGLLLGAIFATWTWSVIHRSPLEFDVMRDRNALYRVLADGGVENVYTLRLVNKRPRAHTYSVDIEPVAGLSLLDAPVSVTAAAEEVVSLVVTLRAGSNVASGRTDIVFTVQSLDDPTIRDRHESRFFGPMP